MGTGEVVAGTEEVIRFAFVTLPVGLVTDDEGVRDWVVFVNGELKQRPLSQNTRPDSVNVTFFDTVVVRANVVVMLAVPLNDIVVTDTLLREVTGLVVVRTVMKVVLRGIWKVWILSGVVDLDGDGVFVQFLHIISVSCYF